MTLNLGFNFREAVATSSRPQYVTAPVSCLRRLQTQTPPPAPSPIKRLHATYHANRCSNLEQLARIERRTPCWACSLLMLISFSRN